MTRAASGSDRATVASAVAELGSWASSLTWTDAPAAARARMELVLLDSLGVMVLGATAHEQRTVVQAWRPAPGPAPLVGGGLSTSTEAAAWLNAVALVRYELDEGHKYAKGHPGAHVLPAVLALAADLDASGSDTRPPCWPATRWPLGSVGPPGRIPVVTRTAPGGWPGLPPGARDCSG